MRSHNAARIVLTCSLVVVLCSTIFAGPYKDLAKRLASASPADFSNLLKTIDPKVNDKELLETIAKYQSLGADQSSAAKDEERVIRSTVEALAATEDFSRDPDAQSKVNKIKSTPIYRDAGNADSSNWLAKAMGRLKGEAPKMPKLEILN